MARGPELEHRRLLVEHYMLASRLARVLERQLDERFEQAGLKDMTTARSNVLLILFQAGKPLTAQTLAERMGVTAVTIGRLVRALEAGGWLHREADPNDGRAYLLSPTRQARRALPKFIAISNEFFDKAYENVSDEELEQRIDAVRQRLAEIEAAGNAEPPRRRSG